MVAIFVILTILACVSVDALIQARRKKRTAPAGGARPVQSLAEGLEIPPTLFVHPGHTWAEIQPTGKVRVGIDDFVRRVIGTPDRIVLLNAGKQVQQGEPMLSLEKEGRRILLAAPVSGTIQAANHRVCAAPESLEEDTYHAGWIYALSPARLGEEIGRLKVAETAATWLQDELRRFTEWLTGRTALQPVAALQDGGAPAVGALNHLPRDDWKAFQAQFLTLTEDNIERPNRRA